MTQLRERQLIASSEVQSHDNSKVTRPEALDRESSSLAQSDTPASESRMNDIAIENSRSHLPAAIPWPDMPESRRRKTATGPSVDDFEEPIVMAAPREPATAEFSYESAPEDLKISQEPSLWKGGAQLLPEPMYVSQLDQKKSPDIRGGGWVAIDVAKSEIVPVELFKAPKRQGQSRRVIEAKYVDGRAVSPTETGFPIVRGMPGLQPGQFHVFENPPCLVRYSGVSEEEVCEITLRGSKIRYKFEPPVIPEGETAPDFIFSNVYVDLGRGRWKKIASFNESFHPIGDANRDGAPDFYVESVTDFDESGSHVLLLSKSNQDEIDYTSYVARFKGH